MYSGILCRDVETIFFSSSPYAAQMRVTQRFASRMSVIDYEGRDAILEAYNGLFKWIQMHLGIDRTRDLAPILTRMRVMRDEMRGSPSRRELKQNALPKPNEDTLVVQLLLQAGITSPGKAVRVIAPATDGVAQMRVSELKSKLRELNIRPVGKKAALVQQLRKAMKSPAGGAGRGSDGGDGGGSAAATPAIAVETKATTARLVRVVTDHRAGEMSGDAELRVAHSLCGRRYVRAGVSGSVLRASIGNDNIVRLLCVADDALSTATWHPIAEAQSWTLIAKADDAADMNIECLPEDGSEAAQRRKRGRVLIAAALRSDATKKPTAKGGVSGAPTGVGGGLFVGSGNVEELYVHVEERSQLAMKGFAGKRRAELDVQRCTLAEVKELHDAVRRKAVIDLTVETPPFVFADATLAAERAACAELKQLEHRIAKAHSAGKSRLKRALTAQWEKLLEETYSP